MRSLTNSENSSSNNLQIACCSIQEADYDYVNCFVSQRWFWSVLRYYFSKAELSFTILYFFFFVYFFGGLECVGHSFAYVAHLWFLRDVWIRTQSTAVASWSATDLATHPSILYELPPVLLGGLPVKSPELVSDFREQLGTLKVFF